MGKKRLVKKGLEAGSKKDEMVDVLFVALMQEEAAKARKSELSSKSLQDLKELLSHEAKCSEDLKAFEAKVLEAGAQKEEELDTKTNNALKEMCASKGLAVGGSKEDRIERLVEEAQKDGEMDKLVSINLRTKRRQELMSMEKPAVVKLCETT